jgi:hypothetical protein
LTIGIAVIGVLDAAAGCAAIVVFFIGVTLLGGVSSADSLRLLLGLATLWFAVPLIASAARPLRRHPSETLGQIWDRGADFVIASLIGGWAVQKIVGALSGLAGIRLPITAHGDLIAFIVLLSLVIRMLVESLAANYYPNRLGTVHPASIPPASTRQRLAATGLRTGLFLFIAVVVAHDSWQLWVGAALFCVPQIVALYERRFPNFPSIYRVLPRGVVKVVLMLVVGKLMAMLVFATLNDPQQILAYAFILLAIPGLVLSALDLFGREGPEPEMSWSMRIAGSAILAAGILLVVGVIG